MLPMRTTSYKLSLEMLRFSMSLHPLSNDKRIAEVLLWLFHSLALCCAIAGEFAMYTACKLISRPDSITIYVAYHHQKFSSDISAMLQLQRTLAFSFGCLDFYWFLNALYPVK